ncbi:hypothetical protein N9W89_00335 [Hellea sp.]|nr:hypothetical protein [Hellea sp.]
MRILENGSNLKSQARILFASFGVMLVISFYLMANFQTFYASFGVLITAAIIWQIDKLKDKQDRTIRFRILTGLAGIHIALVPVMILAWVNASDTFIKSNPSFSEIFVSIAPISVVMLLGVMVGLERQEAAKEYSRQDERPIRFYGRERSKNIRTIGK